MNSKIQMEKVHELLKRAGEILCAEQEEDRISGRRFNIFVVLEVERSELDHSRFLAALLDPKGIHAQKAHFLKTFLKDILLEQTGRSDLQKSEVRTEVSIQSGRLDVLITLPDRQLIVIENKIDHAEGEAQLERYKNWLQKQPSSESGRPHRLVFLTPDGRQPSSCSSTDVKCLSYEHIACWLNKLRSEVPDPVRHVIGQYVDLWRGIAMNSEINTLVCDPRNFEAAESISRAIEEITQWSVN